MIPPWLLAKFGPSLTRLGVYAACASAIWLHGCDYGEDREVGKRVALERSYAVAAAQAAGREAERLRVWTNAAKVAGERYAERAQIADRSFDASLDRLRNAYSSSERVRATATAPEGCPGSSGPTAAELLRAGETIAGLARDADRDREALRACVSAWPK